MAYRIARHEMTTEEITRALLTDWRPRWNALANDSVVASAALEQGATTREELLRVIDRLGDQRAIIYSPAVATALQAAKNNHPYNSFDAYAVEKRVFDKAEELKFNIQSAADLSDIMSSLIENERIPTNSYGQELQQQQRGIEQRTNEINSITR